MRGLIQAELLKIRTTKLVWGMLALDVGFVLLQVIALVALAGSGTEGNDLPPLTDPDMVRAVYSSAAVGIVFVMILGVIGMTGEYRHQTITQVFLTTPRREKVIAAKLAAYFLVGALAGLIAVLVTVSIALPGIELRDGLSSPLQNGVPATLGGTVLATGLYALMGLGLGSLLRNQIAAIVVAIGWMMVLEDIVQLVLPAVGKWLPGGGVDAIMRTDVGGGPDSADLLPAWGGALLLLGYGLAFASVAALTTVRRDIT